MSEPFQLPANLIPKTISHDYFSPGSVRKQVGVELAQRSHWTQEVLKAVCYAMPMDHTNHELVEIALESMADCFGGYEQLVNKNEVN